MCEGAKKIQLDFRRASSHKNSTDEKFTVFWSDTHRYNRTPTIITHYPLSTVPTTVPQTFNLDDDDDNEYDEDNDDEDVEDGNEDDDEEEKDNDDDDDDNDDDNKDDNDKETMINI